MAKKEDKQTAEQGNTADASSTGNAQDSTKWPFFELPFFSSALKGAYQGNVARFESMLEQLEALEAKQHEKAYELWSEINRLGRTGLDYARKISADLRNSATETVRQSTAFWTQV